MKQWYTLYTKPNAEYQVAAALQQRGFQTFLPEITQTRPDKSSSRKPFFPCYLFVNVDLKAVGFSSIRWTPGLRRLVAFGDRPTPVPHKVIQLLQHKLEEVGELPQHGFKPGDTVRITEGPLEDMVAIFDGPTTPAKRVQVLLDILGQASRVQIDPDNLAKAPDTARPEMPAKRPRRTRGRGRRIKRN